MLVRLREVCSCVVPVYCTLATSIFTLFYEMVFLVGLSKLTDFSVFGYNIQLLANGWPFHRVTLGIGF